MGATNSVETSEASPSSPSPGVTSSRKASPPFLTDVVGPNHPLYTLVHASPTPPTDPDASFYQTLFTQVAVLKKAHPTLRPLTSLVRQALVTPTSSHATALSTSLRATVYHIRQSHEDPASSRNTQYGAIQFALFILQDLNSYATSPTLAYLAIAAGPAEAQLPTRDRVDLARSLQSHLTLALLDLVSSQSLSLSTLFICLRSLLLSLTEHPNQTQHECDLIPLLPARYPNASSVVLQLLRVISDTAQFTNPDAQLATDVVPLPKLTATINQPSSTATPDILSIWDALTASVATINLKSRFTDVMTALSLSPGRDSSATSQYPNPQQQPHYHHYSESKTEYEPNTTSLFGLTFSVPTTHGGFNHPRVTNTNSTTEDGQQNTPQLTTKQYAELGEYALALLGLLCRITNSSSLAWTDNAFASTLTNLQDVQHEFGKLYDMLSGWVAIPAGALLFYDLINYNRRFCTYVLARTDPDVIIAPLLASLRVRSGIGGISADARIISCILLQLTSDAGLCAAINEISMPNKWLPKDLLFHHHHQQVKEVDDHSIIMVNVAILAVCSRVVQQCIMNKRQRPDGFVATACLGIMINVAKDVSHIPSVIAERVVGLVELLGRRRRKLVQEGGTETKKRLSELVSELIGMSLEVVVALVKDRPSVAVNRHVVYAVMQHEKGLQGEHVGDCSAKNQALSHMIGRMGRFFSDRVMNTGRFNHDGNDQDDDNDDGDGDSDAGNRWYGKANGQRKQDRRPRGRSSEGHGLAAEGKTWAPEHTAISVERVLQVIEQNGRWLYQHNVFDGVPEVTYLYRVSSKQSGEFARLYAQSVATRVLRKTTNQMGVTSKENTVFDVSR